MAWDQQQTDYSAGRGFAWPATKEPDDTGQQVSENVGWGMGNALAAHYDDLVARDRDYFEQALPNRILDERERREEVPWWERVTAPLGQVHRDWRTYTPTPIRRGHGGPNLATGIVDTIGRGIGNRMARKDAAAEVASMSDEAPWVITPKKGSQFDSVLGI